MAEIIPMPDLGFEADEGELSVWLKGVGDAVQAGEPIAEFESDKVTLEVESPVAGVLLEHLIQPGESVAEGAPIARSWGGRGTLRLASVCSVSCQRACPTTARATGSEDAIHSFAGRAAGE